VNQPLSREIHVVARGVFTSVADLKRKFMHHIRHYNQAPRTVKWRDFDRARRITSTSAATVHERAEFHRLVACRGRVENRQARMAQCGFQF
jgi:hypothetical protein